MTDTRTLPSWSTAYLEELTPTEKVISRFVMSLKLRSELEMEARNRGLSVPETIRMILMKELYEWR